MLRLMKMMSGGTNYTVDELAQKHLKRKGNSWVLDTDICNYAGAVDCQSQ